MGMERMSGSLPAVVMRGGTSRGLVLDGRTLPADEAECERVVAAMFGAGSPGQIDGLGGGVPHTSKVAVVRPSESPDADVDYLFGQVSVREAAVDFSGTCGNMASAVALFAHQEGMVRSEAKPGVVRIRQSRGGQILEAEVRDEGTSADPGGGLPATGAEVLLDLAGMQGASAGAMLPTGNARDDLTLPDGTLVPCSIVDIGNVLAFVPAHAVGLSGHERPDEIEALPVMETLALLRGAVAVRLGWCATPEEWLDASGRLPFVALVSSPPEETAEPADLTVRLYAVGRIHRSIAVTAVAACGAGAAIPGSVVQDVLTRPFAELAAGTPDSEDVPVCVAHPSGVARVGVRLGRTDDGTRWPTGLRYLRTARRIMEGAVFVELPVTEEPETVTA